MRKPQTVDGSAPNTSPPHCNPGELAKHHPKLADALARSTWEDGTPKRPAEILLSVKGRSMFATLRLKGTGYQLEVELPDPLLIWDALEAVLSLETVPWAVNEWDAVPTPKKGKKS